MTMAESLLVIMLMTMKIIRIRIDTADNDDYGAYPHFNGINTDRQE